MDLFCQVKERLSDQIIKETDSFYVLHDGYPLIEGHLLIIPKKHFRCFLELDRNLKIEFLQLKKQIYDFLTENYVRPIYFEHGVVGQTILHAHIQVLPTKKTIFNQLRRISTLLKKPAIPYLYYEENRAHYYFRPKIIIPPGYLHSTLFANILNRPNLGKDRAKDQSRWLLQVKEKYKIWEQKMI